jgi:hypothetical protein
VRGCVCDQLVRLPACCLATSSTTAVSQARPAAFTAVATQFNESLRLERFGVVATLMLSAVEAAGQSFSA